MELCETCEVEGPRDGEISPLFRDGIGLHRAGHQAGAALMLSFLPFLRAVIERLGGEVDEDRVAKWRRITQKTAG